MTMSAAPTDGLKAFGTQWTRPSDEPHFLSALRDRATAAVETQGFPTTRNEDWHFTSPASIVNSTYGPMAAARSHDGIDIAALAPADSRWTTLVFVNGHFAPQLSRVPEPARGVRLMNLVAAQREEPTLVGQHLGQVARFEEQALAFSAVNTATMGDGLFLHVDANATVEAPIHLVYLSVAGADGGMVCPRNLIVLGANAQATVVEHYAAVNADRYFTNAVTEAVIEDGATLRHYRLQQESRAAHHVGHVEVRQGRNSHYVSFSFATGAALSRINIYAGLAGQGCGATLNGLYMIDGEQTCDHQTRIEHAEPDCYSRELYKGVLDDRSHGVFNGKVYVHPIAQKTDGKQTNNSLLLSPDARIDTKPQLEIFADDVKCTHGATVGQLDERMAFYLKSRGITAERSRQLLTYAFAADVLETIELEALRVMLEAAAFERFSA